MWGTLAETLSQTFSFVKRIYPAFDFFRGVLTISNTRSSSSLLLFCKRRKRVMIETEGFQHVIFNREQSVIFFFSVVSPPYKMLVQVHECNPFVRF